VLRILGSKWLRIAFGLIAVAGIGYAIVDQWHNLGPRLDQLSVLGILESSVAVLAGMAAMLLSWRAGMAGLAGPLRLADAGRIFYLSQLGKYIPGSVWPLIAQTALGADVGIPASASVMALVFMYLIFTTSAALVAAVCLPAVTHLVPIWLAVLAFVVGLVLLLPPVLNRLINLGLTLMRRPDTVHLHPRAILASFGWAVVLWTCFGLQILALAHDLRHPLSWHLLLISVGGYTLAWICGFLFILAPAGGGVRELVLTALLVASVGRSDALAVALLSRLLLTAADLVCALGAAASLGPAKLRELRAKAAQRRAAPAAG
jgi:uncharacterized membrane protein YbhN (UPF0104 family)